ncbi:Sensors of blue-light using FAD [Polaromonas sp. YR568]|uniref:BLUF domain-containing protein n=1 Tax=Polaromonas sp. YR568 TaxID=1855301 RepID=UPI0008EAE48E|nr:BLUF domain-containing protein [Polaromonas sp. YR568]SFU33431.1 Sensors of blue-light using FAD [Polaromonas sp. YR568]
MVNSVAPYEATPEHIEVERVITASICHVREGIFAQMENIRAASLRNNAIHDIHAVLLHQSGWFLHWVEGPSQSVRGLLRHLAGDPRHHSPRTVHTSQGRRILPTPWSMMMSQTTEPAAHFGHRVVSLHEQFEQGTQHAPSSVLRRLSAPMQLAQAQGLPDIEAFHRVGICAAGGNEAFEMINWLAVQLGGTVARRRFAGEQDMDGSSNSVDFMDGPHPCRMIAVARNGLAHGLRRAFLPDWPHFVMLFCGTPRFDDALMARMAAACEGLPVTPTLLGIAPDDATHQRMQDMAHGAHLAYIAANTARPDDYHAIWLAVHEQLQRAGEPPSSVWEMPRLVA